jgi:uncharacterized protein (DUF1778 family)
MRVQPKTEQLQIRVSETEKAELQRRAQAAGMSVSAWVLARLLPAKAAVFRALLHQLAATEQSSFVLAELSDLLAELSAVEFPSVLATAPTAKLPQWLAAYAAAMIDYICSLLPRPHSGGAICSSTPAWETGSECHSSAQPTFATFLPS